MKRRTWLSLGTLGLAITTWNGVALAAETGLSVYGLGSNTFNAGIAAPPGTYVTPFAAYYAGVIEGSATVGGVPVSAGLDLGFVQTGINLLYAPEAQFLGGQLGLGATVGLGYVDLTASLSAGGLGTTEEVAGWGLLDTTVRAQLGWSEGTLFYMAYLQAVLPTGTYEPGFEPNTGLNRPALDGGAAFTWIEPESKIQVNAVAGLTYNFENTATDYQTGVEFHLEWAVGKDFGNGLTLGVVGYNYRQLTEDSGPGAVLGPFKGSVDAVGLGLNYATQLDQTPVIFSLKHYQEFNAVNRFEGSSTTATMTMAF